MSDNIDRIALEIDTQAGKSTNNIDILITKLSNLKRSTQGVSGGLNGVSKALDRLSVSSKQVNTINFTGLQRGLNTIVYTVNRINRTGGDIASTASNLKSLSNALNGSRKSIGALATSSKELKKADISGFTKQIMELSKLGRYTSDIMQFKEATSTLGRSLKSLEKGSAALQQFINNINKIEHLDTFDAKVKKLVPSLNQLASAMNNAKNASQGFNKSTRGSTQALGRMSGGLGILNSNVLRQGVSIYALSKFFTTAISETNNYIETLNMFNVTMGTSTKKAWDFVSSLETIGINLTDAMRYQGAFFNISKSLGVTAENAYTLSEQFTKLSYDYASFFDRRPEDMFIKLQSAIVGEIEPVRQLGKDISETRLQQIAWNLGINENIRNMDQASKAELRFIAIMQQSAAEMNDMERTINSPANAIRVLRAQFRMLSIEIANVFIPVISRILPVVIAVVKVLRTLIQTIAGLFGIHLPTPDFGQKDTFGMSDQHLRDMAGNSGAVADNSHKTAKSTGKTAKNLKKAKDSLKKMKDFATGIDELNILKPDVPEKKEDKPSTGGVGGGIGGGGIGGGGIGGDGLGLDLSKFGYEEVLENVKMKADEIYDKIMQWKIPLLAVGGLLASVFAINKIADFIRYIKKVIKNFNLIKTTITGLPGALSNVFRLKGLGNKLLQLKSVQTILKWFKTGVKGIGTKLDKIFHLKSLGKALLQLKGVQTVLNWFKTTGSKIKILLKPYLKGGTKGFAKSISNLLVSVVKKIGLKGIVKKLGLAGLVVGVVIEFISLLKLGMENDMDADDFAELFQEKFDDAMEKLKTLFSNIDDIIEGFGTALEGLGAAIGEYLGSEEFKETAKKAIDAAWELIKSIFKTTFAIGGGLAEFLNLDQLVPDFDQIKEDFSKAFEDYKEFWKKKWGSLKGKYDEVTDKLKGWWGDIKDKFGTWWEDKSNGFKESWTNGWNTLKGKYDDVTDKLKGWWGDIKSKFGTWWNNKTDGFKQGWEDKWSKLKTNFSEITDALKKWWDKIKTKFEEWFGDDDEGSGTFTETWGSKWSKLKTEFKNVTDKLKKWWDKFITKFKEWFGSEDDTDSSFSATWEKKWNSLKTNFKEVTDKLKGWWGDIKSAFNDWKKDFAASWDNFFGGLKGKELPNTKGSLSSYGYGEISPARIGIAPTPTMMAFARGGFVPNSGSFVSPDFWTAGEAGKELIGTYRGKTTVMPLENTSFVSAIHDAVYTAVKSAEGEKETTILVKPELKLDSKDIAQGQDEYKYKSGGGLIKKRR